ncbi:hypothetical protein ABI_46500 [Asticcacaulis biprosthecium C19]|uniref:Uncharacterized protein n=1 Tax=Asticcacaulis biprosthecium C19 TaxID=715226 RepID=F4QU02_9CAUL|nr:hypothetical protein ABI_46500 [Asticcacaulis biprosthecium C19]
MQTLDVEDAAQALAFDVVAVVGHMLDAVLLPTRGGDGGGGQEGGAVFVEEVVDGGLKPRRVAGGEFARGQDTVMFVDKGEAGAPLDGQIAKQNSVRHISGPLYRSPGGGSCGIIPIER